MKIIIYVLFFTTVLTINAQVFPGTPVSGFPSGTTAEIIAFPNPLQGLVAYSTNEHVFYYYDGGTSSWVRLGNDNLGNHTATQNIIMGPNWISGDGGNEGIFIDNIGEVGIGTNNPERLLHVAGTNGGIRLDRYNNDAFFLFVNFSDAGTTVQQNWGFVNENANNHFQIRNFGTALGGIGIGDPFEIKPNNQIRFPEYTGTNFDDNTVTKLLGVQTNGDIVKVDNTLGNTPSFFEAYDSTGGTAASENGTFTTLNLNVQRINQGGFVLNNDIVTVPTNGVYEISYSATFTVNTNFNSRIETIIELNGGEIAGSSSYVGLDNFGDIYSSSKTILISLSAGDEITIASNRLGSANGTATTVAGGTNLVIKKLN